jgi:tetratricopeptide (TPR) repeat protein
MSSTPAHPDTMETTPQRSFVRSILPWIVAAVMLLVYLVTLDKVVTIQSAPLLARVNGMDWHGIYTQPVYWLVTLPIRWLPAGAQLVGLNFIAALCASLSLALLARCVALLPHDRTQLQRDKLSGEDSFLNIRLAWVPVVLAVLICGLQRTFWEHAIINTGEAIDLLLFAYCVRCLLEYRIDERDAWLNKLAFVYGLAITNNFAMIVFFPALLAALIWIKGLRFFRFNFLVRSFLLGLAGLSFYLLLPIVQPGGEAESVTFWQALKTNLVYQKQYLAGFPRWRAGWIGLYALVPLLLAGIRWPSSFGDTSPVGSAFTNIFAQILHAGLLGFCIYIAFDPPVGPREFGMGLAYLPCYFLGALSIGYLSGFLLMVFSGGPVKSRRRSGVPPMVNYAVTAVVCGGAIFAVGLLAARSYPKIQEAMAPALHDYATALALSLPEKPALVLSDDALRLYAVAAVLGRDAVDKHILVDTTELPKPAYQAHLRQRYGDRWPKLELEKGYAGINGLQILQAFKDLGNTRELIYLHPGFGYYFETYYLEPRQHAYVMKLLPAGAGERPVPSAALISQQEAAWNQLAVKTWPELKSALPAEATERLNNNAAYVGSYYSRALNWWGVELQRAERFDEAAKFFAEAINLNPDNAAAIINQEANTLWRNGRQLLPRLSPVSEEKLNLYRGLDNLLGLCGPLDVPDFCMELANTYVQTGLFREAAHMVQRALFYAPNNLIYQAARANVEVLSGQPARALEYIASLRTRAVGADPSLQIEIERIAAFAEYDRGNLPAAEKLLDAVIRKFPDQDAGYNALSHIYVTHSMKLRASGDPGAGFPLTNALRVIERQIKVQPRNPSARFNHGNLLVFVGDHAGAVGEFTEVLKLQKDNTAALLNRAITYLRNKQYDEAGRDYQELLSRYTTTDFRVYYGLGEIAYQKQDWKAAKDHYTQYLKYAPATSAEAQSIRQRLEEVKKKD